MAETFRRIQNAFLLIAGFLPVLPYSVPAPRAGRIVRWEAMGAFITDNTGWLIRLAMEIPEWLRIKFD